MAVLLISDLLLDDSTKKAETKSILINEGISNNALMIVIFKNLIRP